MISLPRPFSPFRRVGGLVGLWKMRQSDFETASGQAEQIALPKYLMRLRSGAAAEMAIETG